MIICNRENLKSHLITAVHSYKRTNPDIDIRSLQKYLQKHLINPTYSSIGTSEIVLEHPAYSIDPQRYTL